MELLGLQMENARLQESQYWSQYVQHAVPDNADHADTFQQSSSTMLPSDAQSYLEEAIEQYDNGMEHARRGEYEDAIASYDAALKTHPGYKYAHRAKGVALVDAGPGTRRPFAAVMLRWT